MKGILICLIMMTGTAHAALIRPMELPSGVVLSNAYIVAEGMRMDVSSASGMAFDCSINYKVYKDKAAFLAGKQNIWAGNESLPFVSLTAETAGQIAQQVAMLREPADLLKIAETALMLIWGDATPDE